MEKMMTITEVAKMLGISPRTIERWEETGKVKRDQRGWRVYNQKDAEKLIAFHIVKSFS